MHISEEDLWSYFNNEIDEDNRLMVKEHLKTCDLCAGKLSALENEELFFQNLEYPLPGDSFSSNASEMIFSKFKHKRNPWRVIFKTCLAISLILIFVLAAWLVRNTPIDLSVLENTGKLILYVLPLALMIFIVKNFEVSRGYN